MGKRTLPDWVIRTQEAEKSRRKKEAEFHKQKFDKFVASGGLKDTPAQDPNQVMSKDWFARVLAAEKAKKARTARKSQEYLDNLDKPRTPLTDSELKAKTGLPSPSELRQRHGLDKPEKTQKYMTSKEAQDYLKEQIPDTPPATPPPIKQRRRNVSEEMLDTKHGYDTPPATPTPSKYRTLRGETWQERQEREKARTSRGSSRTIIGRPGYQGGSQGGPPLSPAMARLKRRRPRRLGRSRVSGVLPSSVA